MIQDIYPHIYHNEYKPVPPDGGSYILAYEGRRILLGADPADGSDKNTDGFPSALRLPRFDDLGPAAAAGRWLYLFSIDGDRFYLLPDADLSELPGFSFQDIRPLRSAAPQYLAFAGITGLQLDGWYKSRRFCGRCGRPMIHSQTERQMHCPSCGQMEYPVLSPAVIVAVTNGNRLLMSKYAGRNMPFYALIAGFAEIGETIEETVRREVMEEVGLKVKNLRYYKSQPWSFSGTLLFGFFCEVDGSDALTVDHSELSTAGWFSRGEIRGQGNQASLTNEMMLVFAAGKEPV